MAAVLTPSGRLALDPVAFIVANQMLTIGMLSPAVLLQDGASVGDVLTWDGWVWGPAAPTGGSVLDLEGGSQATTLYGSDVEGGDQSTLYNPLFDLDDGGP